MNSSTDIRKGPGATNTEGPDIKNFQSDFPSNLGESKPDDDAVRVPPSTWIQVGLGYSVQFELQEGLEPQRPWLVITTWCPFQPSGRELQRVLDCDRYQAELLKFVTKMNEQMTSWTGGMA